MRLSLGLFISHFVLYKNLWPSQLNNTHKGGGCHERCDWRYVGHHCGHCLVSPVDRSALAGVYCFNLKAHYDEFDKWLETADVESNKERAELLAGLQRVMAQPNPPQKDAL